MNVGREEARLCGRTAIGRVTVWVLDANADEQVEHRKRS